MRFRTAVITLLIFVSLSAIHLFIYTQNINLKFKVRELKIQLEQIRSKNRQNGYIVAKKENLISIEQIAMRKLGMVYPEKINYIIVSQDQKQSFVGKGAQITSREPQN
ncbi:MAG: hypothetical protein KKA31_06485 [Candidatus Margulisbacteria bacterium]|nr:hypothetical protein [Candidatus Margulisiibacteriota bacterium]